MLAIADRGRLLASHGWPCLAMAGRHLFFGRLPAGSNPMFSFSTTKNHDHVNHAKEQIRNGEQLDSLFKPKEFIDMTKKTAFMFDYVSISFDSQIMAPDLLDHRILGP